LARHKTIVDIKVKSHMFNNKNNSLEMPLSSLSSATAYMIESNGLADSQIDAVIFTNKKGQVQKCTFYDFIDSAMLVPSDARDIDPALVIIGAKGEWWLERSREHNGWILEYSSRSDNKNQINAADYKWSPWPPTPSELRCNANANAFINA
jgi:hypothetical protein